MQQVPPGYDPRGTGPRRPPGGGDRDYPSGGYPSAATPATARAATRGATPASATTRSCPASAPAMTSTAATSSTTAAATPAGAGPPRPRRPRRRPRSRPGRGPDGRGRPSSPARTSASAATAAAPATTTAIPATPRPARRDRDDWDGNGGDGGAGGYGGDGPRRRRRGPIRRLAPWIALLVIVVPLAIGGLHVWDIYQAKVHPADYTGAGTAPTVTVQVTSGDDRRAARPDAAARRRDREHPRVRARGREQQPTRRGLEPGYFVLNSHMQASLAWADLTNPKNMVQTVVTIPEGKRASQVIAIVAKETKIPLKDFQTVLDHPSELGLPSYANGKVEGYLFPATYAIPRTRPRCRSCRRWSPGSTQEANADRPARRGPAAGHLGDRRDHRGVAWPRPRAARSPTTRRSPRSSTTGSGSTWPCSSTACCSTASTSTRSTSTDAQIATPGPYNDFEHTGLPPGPIANPGDAAIQGILHPDTGNWLYFLTVTGGKSEFSATPLAGQ